MMKCTKVSYLIARSIISNSFSGGNEKKSKRPVGSSIVRALRLKTGGQSCNIPPVYDEMVLKCLIYLVNKHIKCLGQF